MRGLRPFASVVAVLITLSGCTTKPDSASKKSDGTTAACATIAAGTTADGDKVDVCEKMFGTRPHIRPPADTISSDGPSTLYVAADDVGYRILVDRTGTRYRTLIDGRPVEDPAALPKALHAPSQRVLFTIYEVTGKLADRTGDDSEPPYTKSIDLTDAKPVILIKGRAIDELFKGPWEGTMSKRAPDAGCTLTTPCWDPAQTTGLRVNFSTLTKIDNVISGRFDDTEPLADGERFKLTGVIENLSTAIKAADGTCMPALNSFGDASPFRPSTKGDLTLYRYPGMHSPEDAQLVIDYPVDTEGLGGQNGMDTLTVLHPANFLAAGDDHDWAKVTIHNHAIPNGSEVVLWPVTGGGGTCTA